MISVRRPDRPADQMTIEEQKKLTYTRAILAEPFWKVAISLIAIFLSNPSAFSAGSGLWFDSAGEIRDRRWLTFSTLRKP